MRFRSVSAKFTAWAMHRCELLGVGEEEFLERTSNVPLDGRLNEVQYRRTVDLLTTLPGVLRPISEDFLEGMLPGLPVFASACVNARTLDEALRTFEYGRALLTEFDQCEMALSESAVEVHYQGESGGESDAFSAIGHFIMVLNLMRVYAASQAVVEEIEIAAPTLAGRNEESVASFFRCRIRTGARRTVMRVRCALLRHPSDNYNATLQRFTLRQLEEQMTTLRNGMGMRELVLGELGALIDGDDWEATSLQPQLCERLGIRPRILAASLHEARTSFSALLAEVRFRRAMELLDGRAGSIASVSEALRFSGQGAFTRFFLRKSGMTPTDFKRRRQTR